MQKQQHFIEVTRTAEYYTLIPENQKVKKVLFVIHGYSQLPEYFVEHFRDLLELGIAVVAPSGLSLGYQSGFYGRVGASWMTKHNRLNEIQDYINYLDQLITELKLRFKEAGSFSVLGFSQGSATASRWFSCTEHPLDELICCAGAVAEDVDVDLLKEKLGNKKLRYYIGKQDEFVKGEKIKEHLNLLEDNKLPVEMNYFNGGHEIPKALLFDFFKELEKNGVNSN